MRSGSAIRLTVLAIVAFATFLILRSSSIKTQPGQKEPKEECCRKKSRVLDYNNVIWGTFSRQLIYVSALPIAQ